MYQQDRYNMNKQSFGKNNVKAGGAKKNMRLHQDEEEVLSSLSGFSNSDNEDVVPQLHQKMKNGGSPGV